MLFDPQAQLQAQQPLSKLVEETGQPYPYMRPAFEALLFAPLSRFRYLSAFGAWDVLSYLILVVVVLLLRSKFSALRQVPLIFWPVFPLAFFPTTVLLVQGQDDALLLLLLTLCFLAVRKKSDRRAGAYLGLGLFRPQFAIPMFLTFAYGGNWGVLTGFCVVALGLTATTIAVFGQQQLLEYPHRLVSIEQAVAQGKALLHHMPNFHGLLGELSGRPYSGAVAVGLVLVASAVTFLVTAEIWRRTRLGSPDLAFSAAVISALLVSYHSFAHDLTLLLLPILLQTNWLLARKIVTRRTVWLLLAPAAVLFIPPICALLVRAGAFHLYTIGLVLWLAGTLLAIREENSTATWPSDLKNSGSVPPPTAVQAF